MPNPLLQPRTLRTVFGAGLLLATAGCVAPPPPIPRHLPVVSHHPPLTHHRDATRIARCDPPAHTVLTEAEKTRLFDDFDGWRGEQRAPGAVADVPPPPPTPARNGAAPPGCRVSRN